MSIENNRIRVEAGRFKVGDIIQGRKITGFGKPWTKRIEDSDACVYGLMPGQDYLIEFQYAYLGEDSD